MSKIESFKPIHLMDLLEDVFIKQAKRYINMYFYKTFKGIYFHDVINETFEKVSTEDLKLFYLTPDLESDSKKNPFNAYQYLFTSEAPIYYLGEFEDQKPIIQIKRGDENINYINMNYKNYIPEEKPLRIKKTKSKKAKRTKKKIERDNNRNKDRNVSKPEEEDNDEDEKAFREKLNETLGDF